MKLIIRDNNLIWLIAVIVAFGTNLVFANTNTNAIIDNNGSSNNSLNNCDDKDQWVTETLNRNESISTSTHHQPVFSSNSTTSTTTTKPMVTLTSPPSTGDRNNDTTTGFANLCKCGIASFASGKIVGGTPVSENKLWPWFAALVRSDRSTKVHCGASLITRRYVLTAAHCLLPMIQVGLRNFKVKFGYNELVDKRKNENETMSLSEDDKHDKFDIPIESITVHPQYEQSFPYHYDIGVVKLASPVNCSSRVRPICLPSADQLQLSEEEIHANETAITVGFGRTSVYGNHSRVLQQIRLKLISLNECRQHYSQLPFTAPEVLDSMMCAWNKGLDSCVGDSGGPLFLWKKASNVTTSGRRETSSYFKQVGVTSWGIGCANDKYPGVYSRVRKFVPWLKSVIDYDAM